MKQPIYYVRMAVGAALALCLAACSGGSGIEDTVTLPNTVAPLTINFAVPVGAADSDAKTRADVPDPGDDTYDGNDWDRLTIVLAYSTKTQSLNIVDDAPGKMVYYDTFTKEQFEKTLTEAVSNYGSDIIGGTLSKADDNGYRQYTGYVPLGTCRVYGITYSTGQGLDLEATLKAISTDGADKTGTIEALQISNDYATTDGTMDIAKFISVGTGYALKLDNTTGSLTSNKDIIIAFKDEKDGTGSTSVEDKEYWRMNIRRLATKLDIQWDAQGAYEAGKYKNIKVSSLTYDGGSTTAAGTGYGRLFPTLQSADVAAVGGRKTFLNTSEISKRNGRQYHYLFPDGSKTAKVTFTIQSELAADATANNILYVFDFKNHTPLQSATWYKVNTTISGTTFAQGTTEITKDDF